MVSTLLEDDRNTERLLELQARDLPMPDGSTRRFRCMAIHWGSFDFLVNECNYTPERLVELAVLDAELAKKDLDYFFPNAMAFLDEGMRKIKGIS